MIKITKYAVVFGLIVALTGVAGVSGWAEPANPYESALVGIAVPFTNQLTALVTDNPDGSYHYEYTLVFENAAFFGQPLTSFSVGNITGVPFWNQWCDFDFTPASSLDSVYWYVNVPQGNTVHFSYDSAAEFMLVDVTMNAGLPADGQTLGMKPIPEPGALATLAFGLLGIGWTNIRRRR